MIMAVDVGNVKKKRESHSFMAKFFYDARFYIEYKVLEISKF